MLIRFVMLNLFCRNIYLNINFAVTSKCRLMSNLGHLFSQGPYTSDFLCKNFLLRFFHKLLYFDDSYSNFIEIFSLKLVQFKNILMHYYFYFRILQYSVKSFNIFCKIIRLLTVSVFQYYAVLTLSIMLTKYSKLLIVSVTF